MLFRRIKAHIEKENWFAVLIDFLIVVVGILIAFQITEWNEGREDQTKEVEFFEHMLENLRGDLAEYDSTIKTTEWRMSAINEITREATGTEIPHILVTPNSEKKTIAPTPQFEFGTSASTAIGFMATFDGNRSAFNGLVNNGEVRIIGNKKLLRDIQDYYVQMDGTNAMEKRLTIRRDQLVEQRTLAGVAGSDQLTVGQLADIALENPPFFASMRSVWGFSEFQRRVLKAEKTKAEILIARIESELK